MKCPGAKHSERVGLRKGEKKRRRANERWGARMQVTVIRKKNTKLVIVWNKYKKDSSQKSRRLKFKIIRNKGQCPEKRMAILKQFCPALKVILPRMHFSIFLCQRHWYLWVSWLNFIPFFFNIICKVKMSPSEQTGAEKGQNCHGRAFTLLGEV